MRTRSNETVLSREVDEDGTHTTYTGKFVTWGTRFRPHETTADRFRRIVEHVQHVAPLAGPIPAAVWKQETLRVLGLDVVVAYGAGAGLGVAVSRAGESLELCSGQLPAPRVTLDAAGELYGTVVNRAIDILQQRHAG